MPITTPDDLAPEMKAAYDRYLKASTDLKTAAGAMLLALTEAQSVGIEIRQSDIDTIRVRFFEQMPHQLEYKAGALLPNRTARLSMKIPKMVLET